jgi:hypothetical protein
MVPNARCRLLRMTGSSRLRAFVADDRSRLAEPLVQPRPDLVRPQLCPLPLLTGDDDTACCHAGQPGETKNLPKVHDQETLPWTLS